MSVAALILGIISILVSVFSGPLAFSAIVTGILAIVFGAIGRKKEDKKGMATAGFVMGIVSVVLAVLITVSCIACIGAIAGSASLFDIDSLDSLEDIIEEFIEEIEDLSYTGFAFLPSLKAFVA